MKPEEMPDAIPATGRPVRSRRVQHALLGINLSLLIAHLLWTWRGDGRALTIPVRREEPRPAGVAIPVQIAAADTVELRATIPPAAAPPAAAAPIGAPAPESAGESASVVRTAPARTNGSYRIQVGAFQQAENAQALAAKLVRAGHAGEVEIDDRGAAGCWYRVQAGSYADLASARAALAAVINARGCEHAYVRPAATTTLEPLAMDMQTPVPAAGATATEPAIEAVVEPRIDVPVAPPIDAPAEPPLEFVVPESRPVIPAGAPSLEEEYGYAQSRHERGDLAAAVESYRRVLDLDPNHHAARTRLASAYVALGRRVEAESELYLLRDLMGDDPLYLFTVALFDFEARRTREAHLALVRLLDREPDHVRGRLLLGSLFETGGDLERALLEYRHAHRLSPGDPATLYPFARALDAAGRRDEALSAYEQFLAAPVAVHPWLEVRDAVQQRVTWLRRS